MLLLRQWPISSWVPPPPPHTKNRGNTVIVDLAGNKQSCVFPSQRQCWVEISFKKTCVEGETPQVGLNQSLIWPEHHRSPKRLRLYSRIHGELPPRTQQRAAGLPAASSQPESRTPDPRGRRCPFPPSLPSDSDLVTRKSDSIFPFHPYNVLLENHLFILESLK